MRRWSFPPANILKGISPRLGTLLKFLAVMGPGLITANAGNDSGGIATYSAAGAQFGLHMLWIMLLITVSLIVVQLMVARLGVYTGKGLADLIRDELGVRVTAVVMLSFLVASVGTITAEFAGIAASLELFGVSKYVSVPLAHRCCAHSSGRSSGHRSYRPVSSARQ